MVERALSMREVGGSILSFSNVVIVVKMKWNITFK